MPRLYNGAPLPDGLHYLDQLRNGAGVDAEGNPIAGGGAPTVGAGGAGYSITLPDGYMPVFVDPFQFVSLMNSFKPYRRALRVKPFLVGIAPIELLPVDDLRTYFLIVNTHPSNIMYAGFDSPPSVTAGLPIDPGNGSYEPAMVPNNAIFVLGSGANTSGICIYAN